MGILVAAPASGSGKTVFTTGLVAALVARGIEVTAAKVGPDYIDPGYLGAAAGSPCLNLDLWAMRPALVRHLAGRDTLVVEGVMGLFDGPSSGVGSSADVASALGLAVILVVNAAGQSHSVAALVHGFATFDADVRLAGVVLTSVASARHERMLREAVVRTGIPCLGAVPRDDRLTLPSRHLGLVQAREHGDLAAFIGGLRDVIEASCDVAALAEMARIGDGRTMSWHAASTAGTDGADRTLGTPIPPPGSRIAVASDAAFGFTYAHVLDGWRAAGASLHPFSPLGGEGPDVAADAVVLPGGYPELFAGALAAASGWKLGLADAARRGATIYGECGGYMALGDVLVDADGNPHAMAGLLPVTTSFAVRRRTLGYRRLTVSGASWLPAKLRGHEFRYATVERESDALFQAADTDGVPLGPIGSRAGSVAGSFAHVVDREDRAS